MRCYRSNVPDALATWALGVFCAALSLSAAGCGGCQGSTTVSCARDGDCASGMCREGRCVGPSDAGSGRDAGQDSGTCVDLDGDGRGPGCALGADCDDGNRLQTGVEICDGLDNDCDGTPDNGVLSSCGDCDPTCRSGAVGTPSMPFMPTPDNSDGVAVDPGLGGLVLTSRDVNTKFIWIANSGQGSVSKVDTETFAEVARYRTGPGGGGEFPSRTSVNSLGDVYVGNRNSATLTKISVLGSECADITAAGRADGVVRTSTGAADMLDWGVDDCVLWNRPLPVVDGPHYLRAVAAQEIEGPDGELRSFVWVGTWRDLSGDTNPATLRPDDRIWKIDGETGEILFVVDAPVKPYGFALDGRGNLWISSYHMGIGRIDTTRCLDATSCSTPVCTTEPDADTCIRQRLTTPTSGRNHSGYGITVDASQRVWVAGGEVLRYDPAAPLASRWARVDTPGSVHGIGADAAGWVWGAAFSEGVVRIRQDDPSTYQIVAGTTGVNNKGIAIDQDGKVWSILNGNDNSATVITPGPTISEATIVVNVDPTGPQRYTYSDMTGQQLRLATNPRGYYRHVFEGCPDDGMYEPTRWTSLGWNADTPPGTNLRWRVRTAATRAALASTTWTIIGVVPPLANPVDLAAFFVAQTITPQRFVEIEVQLESTRTSGPEVVTPVVRSFDAQHRCVPLFM